MRRFYGLLMVFCGLFLWTDVRAQSVSAVDVAIVFAHDVSASVEPNEYLLQLEGLARAFEDPEVIAKITNGPLGAIAVTYMEWSGAGSQKVQIPWVIIASEVDARKFASLVKNTTRAFTNFTAIWNALLFSAELFDGLPVEAMKKVIDISGDGSNNSSTTAAQDASKAAIDQRSITVNGLPILGTEPEIAKYYEDQIIRGPGAFIVPAADFQDYIRAIKSKFIAEIS